MLRNRLKLRFSPANYLCKSDGVSLLRKGGGGEVWLLSRKMCAFTAISAGSIPRSKRKDFVRTALSRWAPFPDSAHHVEWMGDWALAWAWSSSQLSAVAASSDRVVPKRIVPESIYRGNVETNAVALVEVSEGFEGRVWKGTVLRASQWWPATPSESEWNLFLRGAGRSVAAGGPPVTSGPLAESPWTRRSAPAFEDLVSRHRTVAIGVAIVLATFVLVLPLGSGLRLMLQTSAVARTIAQQDEGLQEIIQAREAAERDEAEIQGLLALRPPASQIELLAAVVTMMPGKDWTLLEWRMPDRETLEVDLRGNSLDPSKLVQAWESSGRFNEVTAQLGRKADEVTMRAKITRQSSGVAG